MIINTTVYFIVIDSITRRERFLFANNRDLLLFDSSNNGIYMICFGVVQVRLFIECDISLLTTFVGVVFVRANGTSFLEDSVSFCLMVDWKLVLELKWKKRGMKVDHTWSFLPFIEFHSIEELAASVVTHLGISNVLALDRDSTFVTVTFVKLGGRSRGHSKIAEIINRYDEKRTCFISNAFYMTLSFLFCSCKM